LCQMNSLSSNPYLGRFQQAGSRHFTADFSLDEPQLHRVALNAAIPVPLAGGGPNLVKGFYDYLVLLAANRMTTFFDLQMSRPLGGYYHRSYMHQTSFGMSKRRFLRTQGWIVLDRRGNFVEM